MTIKMEMTKKSNSFNMIYDFDKNLKAVKLEKPVKKNTLNTNNPFVVILNIDIWILIKIRYYTSALIKTLLPLFNIFFIVSFGASLLMVQELIQLSSKNYESMMNHDDKIDSTMLMAISDYSSIERDNKLDRELIFLKSKTLSLEALVRKMDSQLKTFYENENLKKQILPDFASETVGGSIISTPDTEPYLDESQTQTTLFGIAICKPSYFTPRKIIQPWREPGECWAFKGAKGNVEIELVHLVYLQSVTLEHISKSVSLTGTINSAPREFRILGKIDDKYVVLGVFSYDDEGTSSQNFPLKNQIAESTPIKIVMLQVLSNYGNPDYTCVYRLKVHGKIHKIFQL
ncbi:hypothetical protein HCN44_008275 [Aphidius gifuensis]|uniref:SUN domain-containing protein n=1 Tax=Aphidius gifuensis TaxID=684658 RepID=A0A834XP20_APHGI|nr:SUN domain-containing protein 1-like [Aphidius gifuensis]KAF7989601.1 hypothetical protein HCN44_008275 [Aphidius gifuensis]